MPRPTKGALSQMAAQHKTVAQYLVQQVTQERAALGAPYQSSHLSEREAVQRWLEWHQGGPIVEKAASSLSKADLLAAALDAVKLGKRAEADGITPPPVPPPAPVAPAPAVPMPAPAPGGMVGVPPPPAAPMTPPPGMMQ